jgi:hypothetical protein
MQGATSDSGNVAKCEIQLASPQNDPALRFILRRWGVSEIPPGRFQIARSERNRQALWICKLSQGLLMSDEQMDAIVGRLVREREECQRRVVALDAELKLMEERITDILRRRHLLSREEMRERLAPVERYFHLDAFFELLDQRQRYQDAVSEKVKQLRELGLA